MRKSLKYHDEIILRFDQGHLREVFIDGMPQKDVKSFSIEASIKKVASYVIEHSTMYLDSQKVADDFSGEISEDLH